MKFSKLSALLLFLIAVIAGIGLFLRAHIAYTTELWSDESSSVYDATQVSNRNLILQKGNFYSIQHPSGYYLLLKAWITFGYFDDNWIRTLSLLFFLPTIIVIYKLSRNLALDENASVIVILIFSFHPLLLSLGYQARMYAVTLFFCSLALFFLFHKDQKSTFPTILTAIFLSIAIYLDYLALWIVIGLIILLPLIRKTNTNFFKKIVKILLFSFLLTFPQLIILIKNFLQTGNIYPGSVPQDSFSVDYLLSESCRIFGACFDNVILTVASLCICLIILFIKTKNENINIIKTLLVAIILLSVIYSLAITPVFLARNLSIASILFCIVIAHIFVEKFNSKSIFFTILFVFYMFHLFLSTIKRDSNGNFLFESGLNEFAQHVYQNKSLAVFLPSHNHIVLTAYYFPKNNIPKEQLLFINKELTTNEEQQILSAKEVYLIFDHHCEHNSECSSLLSTMRRLCSVKMIGCEVFFLP